MYKRQEDSRIHFSQLEHGAADHLDQSQAVQTLANMNTINGKIEEDIIRLRKALRNINSEDFGYCTECGIDIPMDRIENNPSVTACFDCQTILELEEKKLYSA